MSGKIIAAGHGRPIAKLTAGVTKDAVLATIGNVPFQKIDVSASIDSFCAAKDAPIFYGATTSGQMVAIACKMASMQVVALVQPVFGVCVDRVVAASKDDAVLFVCRQSDVWLVNMKTPDKATRVGRVSLGGRIVAAFAAPSMAVVVAAHEVKTVRLVPISQSPSVQATWGAPNEDEMLDAPAWAECAACDALYSKVTAHVAGTVVVQSQMEAVLAGPPKTRTRILMTARRSPVVAVAVIDGALRCLLKDKRLVELTRNGRAEIGTAAVMVSSGWFV